VTEARSIRVLIVEDHPIVRLGLRRALEQEGFQVCGEALAVAEAVLCVERDAPDLVTTDLSLGAEDGLDLVRRLSRTHPRLPVLVYSMFEDAAHIERALRAGASGYITKGEAFDVLPGALRTCLAGGRYLSPIAERTRTAAAEARAGLASLSGQERQVYDLLGQGGAIAAIAGELELSPRTIESYCVRIQAKLGLDGMKELRRQAAENPY